MIDSKKIIISLDGMSKDRALKISRSLSSSVWGFKVNDLIYEDLGVIGELKKLGNIFVDVKLYDIPNTVANSVKRLSNRGADIITVHALGGIEMMRKAKENAGTAKIIAVTVLTSSNPKNVVDIVKGLTQDSLVACVDGVVCSGNELDVVNSIKGMTQKLKIVPGVRPSWYQDIDDQVRKITPQEALELGADYLVVGRPITLADNPKEALRALCE